jgi:hypothetical protein
LAHWGLTIQKFFGRIVLGKLIGRGRIIALSLGLTPTYFIFSGYIKTRGTPHRSGLYKLEGMRNLCRGRNQIRNLLPGHLDFRWTLCRQERELKLKSVKVEKLGDSLSCDENPCLIA